MSSALQITLPNNWLPRGYQLSSWKALESGKKRAILVWHRRSGKDDLALHWTASEAMLKVGAYWHMLPQSNQGRKAIWDAVNPKTGKRRIDEAFPKEIRGSTREQDMFIRFVNGSTWQLVGSDNYNSLVGSPPLGVVFSEYALADPGAWDFLRPILAENGGWAIFVTTPRGRNHAARLFEYARQNEQDWFAQVLSVKDTGVISTEIIDRERRELAAIRGDQEANAIIEQEYYCSFDAAIPGAYYGALMARAEAEKRIGQFPYEPSLQVGTAWDIGIGDSTAIWFYQFVNGRTRIIDYYEGSGIGLPEYAKLIHARPYVYADTIWPHDGAQQVWTSGETRLVSAAKLGIKARTLANERVDDGINAVRLMLPQCEFNTVPVPLPNEEPAQAHARMQRGLDALRLYRRQWNDKLQRFDDAPLHDWTSHGADAFRYLAKGRKPFRERDRRTGLPATAIGAGE